MKYLQFKSFKGGIKLRKITVGQALFLAKQGMCLTVSNGRVKGQLEKRGNKYEKLQ